MACASVAFVVTLLAGCSGGSGAAPTIEVREPTAIPTRTPGAAGGPGLTVASVVEACREKDIEQLRGLVSVAVSDDAINAMLANGSDVQLVTQTVPDVTGDSASIDVSLRVTGANGQSEAQRTWQLARGSDGVWRVTALPQCY